MFCTATLLGLFVDNAINFWNGSLTVMRFYLSHDKYYISEKERMSSDEVLSLHP